MMLLRIFVLTAVAVFTLLLPASLAGGDIVFYQCVDDEGKVTFTNTRPSSDERCIRLGAREEQAELDGKVRTCFADTAGTMPVFTGNVIQNGRAGLRRFHEKLEALASDQERPLTIYFVGDSHLQSGDLVRGFVDELELNHQVERTLLCVHKVRRVRVGRGRTRRFVTRLPRGYPDGVPRTCRPLIGNGQIDGDGPYSDPASTDFSGNPLKKSSPPRGTINVYAYGITGKTFGYFADSKFLGKDLVMYRPDLVIVMLGTNDAFARPDEATVKRDILAFVGTVRSTAPCSDVLFITPPDCFFRTGRDNEYIRLIRKELKAISIRNNFAFWDLYTVMGGPRSMVKWEKKGLSQKDRVHFLADGYMILGRLFYQALLQ